MNIQIRRRILLGSAFALTACAVAGAFAAASAPLAIDSARVTISGTSNIHAYTASTTTVRVRRENSPSPSTFIRTLNCGPRKFWNPDTT